MKKEFNWEEFINNNIVVNCKTQNEAVDFLKKLEIIEVISRFTISSKYTYWSYYKKRTCYNVSGKVLMYSPKEHYKNYGYKIIEWSDYMSDNKEFTKDDLKELDIVILKDGERGVFFDGKIIVSYGCKETILYFARYNDCLLMNDRKKDCGDIIKVYRNGQLIFERAVKTPNQIKIDEIKKTIEKLNKQVVELEKEA